MIITKNNLQDVFRAKKCSVEIMELKGYELVKELFVDSSGWGADDELALTSNQFLKEVELLLNKNPKLTAKITGAGQFQVYVGFFIKTGKSKAKKIANNTYRIDNEKNEVIRFHDTDILTFERGFVILNSGGFLTKTTKDRLNKYLPQGVYVYQKDFKWFVKDDRDGTVKEFVDNMRIAS